MTRDRARQSLPQYRGMSVADRITAYHRLGQRIARRVAQGESIRQAIYHEGYSQSEFTAYKAHQFAKVVARDQELDRYRKAAQRGELSWTHIQALIQVKNATERRHYFNASTRGHWSPDRLRREITHRPAFRCEGVVLQGRKFRAPSSAADLDAMLIGMLCRPFNLLNQLLHEDSPIDLPLPAHRREQLNELRRAIEAVGSDRRP